MIKKARILKLVVSVLLTLGTGAIAGMFTAEAVSDWYATLNQPSFNPPNWIFGPVWTTLYIFLGISFFLIWELEASRERNLAIGIFLLQLALNFGWSFIFFYFHRIGLALVEIIMLWMSIVAMLVRFYKLKAWAAYINIPYLCWVTFATVLNAGYFFLNRS
jgi:tryptophan-rich sensory protein